MKKRIYQFICGILLFASCTNSQKSPLTIKKENFQKEVDGKKTDLYSLKNKNGMEVLFTNYGAVIVALTAPDKNGKLDDIVLGYKNVDGYMDGKDPYFGAVVGRYANRICKGKFKIDSAEYTLPINNGPNSLHGGKKGFSENVWDAQQSGDSSITFTLTSPDGDQGYPGTMKAKVVYTLTDKNELFVEYSATTDKPTVINLSQHSYFNLNGEGSGDILGHELMLNADKFTPVDSTLIPTGKNDDVKGTPMDFTQPTKIGARINDNFIQLKYGGGYDHNWVLNKKQEGEMSLAASVYSPESGRFLEVFTTEPGVQFYCGNFLDGSLIGKKDLPYKYRNGLCLETQHFPDSPNQKDFPSTLLLPGKEYHHKTCFKFSVK